jgi:dTDP-glucose pyrophosphorylase
VVGNSNVIDVYSLLYKYAYLNDNFNFISDTHILQPDFIRYFNIHCIESDIRDKSKVSFWNIVIRESVVNELIKVINKLGDCDLVHSNIQQFKNNTNSFRAYQTTLNANIVIPMAGHGSRFTEQGYTDSKPFIDVLGKPMIHQVIRNLAILYNKNYKFIFVCLKDDYEKYNFDDFKYVVKHDNIEIIVLDEITEGATQTILKAKEFINNEEPLWMMNCDQMISYSPHIQLPEIGANTSGKVLTDHLECDGGMLCFYGEGTDWSYAKVGDDGYVTEVAEKKQISNDATAGYYYWNKGSDFVKYAEQMIEHNDRTNGEFYLAPVYNWAIKDGKKFRISYVTKVFELGTPEYLDNYLHNDTHFFSGQKIEDVVKRLK